MSSKQNQATPYLSIQNEHPDISYWKKEEISLIISKGLAKTCRDKPRNPIEFFATWLIEYNNVQKIAKQKLVEEKHINLLKEQNEVVLKQQQQEEEEKQRKADLEQAKKVKFWQDLELSEDPYDYLNQLAEFIHENVGSTGTYIGELEHPFKQINEDADEYAHIDKLNPEVIKFKFSSQNHQDIIVGKELRPNQGITHGVFQDAFTQQNEKIDITAGNIADQFKHIYVKEVVREPKMHFWKVPRLGAFMAIPLVYKSCLSIQSFQIAFDDYNEYSEQVRRQQEEKRIFDEQQLQIQAEKSNLGEVYILENREYPEIILPPIRTDLKKFVVCIDLLGQDRVFSDEQIQFILETIHRFKVYWEKFEKEKLTIDRDALISDKERDLDHFTEEVTQNYIIKEEELINKKIAPEIPEPAAPGQPPLPEVQELSIEQKQFFTKQIKMNYYLELLEKDLVYRERFNDLAERKVIKYQTFFKCIFYLLEFTKEDICLQDTQKLHWKKARHFWNISLIEKMKNSEYQGSKSYKFKSYQTLNFIEKHLNAILLEDIQTYNHSLGIIYKWMVVFIEARKRDIAVRLNQAKLLREKREDKIQEEKDRIEERKRACIEAAEKFEIDNRAEIERYEKYMELKEAGGQMDDFDDDIEPQRPTFDEKFYLFQWNEDHPEIQIPDEIVDDVDNDWVITQLQKEDVINDYLAQLVDPVASTPVVPEQKKR